MFFIVDTEKINDTLTTSISNLQNEVEGTKANIKQLEKRINTIGNELCSIDGNLKLVVQLLTPNPSLHSTSPPSTPYSPYVRPAFSFGSPTSEDIGIESMDNNSLTLGVSSPGYKRHNILDRYKSPIIEKKQLQNCAQIYPWNNRKMADSCDKCVERKDYVAEGPASETVDKFLKLDLKNNLSMSTAECISPTQKSSVFTHPYKPHFSENSKQSVVVTSGQKKENGYVCRTTDL